MKSKIAWNKVTWYSKAIAASLFLVLPFIGLYIGMLSGESLRGILDSIQTALEPLPVPDAVRNHATLYYQNTSLWQTDRRDDVRFSIAYPLDFSTQDFPAPALSSDWAANIQTPGRKLFALMIPKAVEPQSNFADAAVTVGRSGSDAALSGCLQAAQNETEQTSETVNDVPFSVFTSADAAAGNFYQTTSYRTVYNGQCYAVESTTHFTQLANYPAEYGLKPFNQARIDGILKRIVGTFTLL